MDELNKKRLEKADPSSKYRSMQESEYQALSKEEKDSLTESFQFEKQLQQALAVDVPANLADKILLSQRTPNSFRFFSLRPALSMAASITLVMFLLIGRNDDKISTMALTHIYNELDHLVESTEVIDRKRVVAEIQQLGLELPNLPNEISYAGPCVLGDKKGMHIVARVNDSPVTLFISRDSSNGITEFNDNRFSGKVYPSEQGSIIIIGESIDDVNQVYQQTRAI